MRRKITYDPRYDFYDLLGVPIHASPEDLRLAYRDQVRAIHPDRNPDRAEWATEQLKLLNEAYDVLSNPLTRRDYDRQRWLHVPHFMPPMDGKGDRASHTSGRARYRSPFNAPNYDANRPWWEQAAPGMPSDPFASAHAARTRRRAAENARPAWFVISDWLKQHRLGFLEPTWLMLVGLWRSPYALLLMFLGFVLAVNVGVLIYALLTPDGPDSFLGGIKTEMFADSLTVVLEPSARMASSTPEPLFLACNNPDVQIIQPVNNDIVGDVFSVYGTVKHPQLWHYTVQVGYIGESLAVSAISAPWRVVRTPPPNQSVPEPAVIDDLLTGQAVALAGNQPGYYAVRLSVVLRDGSQLSPCDVIVRH